MYSIFRNPRDPHNLQTLQTLKQWIREIACLSDDDEIYISELQCSEPSCPGIETQILVLPSQQPAVSYRILKPLVFIRKTDLEIALKKQS